MGLFNKPQPVRAQADGKLVRCFQCGNDHFWSRSVVMNSASSELFNVAWASPQATALVCSECGLLMHFLPDFLALEK